MRAAPEARRRGARRTGRCAELVGASAPAPVRCRLTGADNPEGPLASPNRVIAVPPRTAMAQCPSGKHWQIVIWLSRVSTTAARQVLGGARSTILCSRTVRRTRGTRRPDQPFWCASVHGNGGLWVQHAGGCSRGFYLRERETDRRCQARPGCLSVMIMADRATVRLPSLGYEPSCARRCRLGQSPVTGLTLQARGTKQARACFVFSAGRPGMRRTGSFRAAWLVRVSRRAG